MTKLRPNIVIAIDGVLPQASPLLRELAKRFNLLHVDTGSRYRTMTHALLEAGASTSDATMVLSLLDQMIFQTRIDGQQAQLEIHEQILLKTNSVHPE